jgi:ATP-dependent Clp protease ATP-binding subunit ClpA
MFERYTQEARRTIFFARHEASQFGSPQIESEHLLLGLLRESKGALNPILGLKSSEEEVRDLVTASTKPRQKFATSVDLKFTNECKRILAYSAEEAERLGAKHIGIEHLALGILREENCLAARILREQGLQVNKARVQIAAAREQLAAGSGVTPSMLTVIGIKIVDASTSEILMRYQSPSRIPQIGEAILIGKAENPTQTYRVQDVVWEFNEDPGDPDGSQLKQVKLQVVKEKTD